MLDKIKLYSKRAKFAAYAARAIMTGSSVIYNIVYDPYDKQAITIHGPHSLIAASTFYLPPDAAGEADTGPPQKGPCPGCGKFHAPFTLGAVTN